MADENNRNNDKNRSINVTKPRGNERPRSSIDASRVSAHTLREQQALDKLRRQVGTIDQHENRASHIKTVVAIILIIILIILMIVLILVIGRTTHSEEENYDIRVSMEIENKSLLSVITETGQEKLREINPGDRIAIRAYVRNSNDYEGDITTSASSTPPSVFVRFRIRLILDYKERYDVIKPTYNKNLWTKFDIEAEELISTGVKDDDHFYYYCGSLPYQRRLQLFDDVLFDGNVLTCDDGGKYGQIQVLVESIEANTDNLANGIWPTAPKRWVIDMIAGKYSNKVIEN